MKTVLSIFFIYILFIHIGYCVQKSEVQLAAEKRRQEFSKKAKLSQQDATSDKKQLPKIKKTQPLNNMKESSIGLLDYDREQKAGNEKYILKVPVYIRQEPENATIQVFVLSKVSGHSSSFSSYYITTRRYRGYQVGRQSKTIDTNQAMSNPTTNFEIKNYHDNIDVSGYYVELFINNRFVDSKLWENKSSVLNLKRKYRLPKKWWLVLKNNPVKH